MTLILYSALGFSAAAALIYEIVASNILLHFFIESTYSIATVLSVFLFGLALGSLVYYRFQKKVSDKLLLFGVLQLLIALYGYFVFTHIPNIVAEVNGLGLLAVSSFVLLIPTTALGVIFPLTVSLVGRESESGLVYFVDLIGAVAGSLLAGFYLIPELGNTFAVYVAALASLLAAFLTLKIQGKTLAVGLAVLFFVLIPNQGQLGVVETGDIDFHKASPYGEVAIENQVLYIDGRDQCSWVYPSDTSERQIVSRVFENIRAPDARVLNVGLGCGLTLEEILKNTTSTVDVVEINPVVVEANRLQTSLLKNPRINLIIDEGLHYLRTLTARYDAVVIDIENPSVIHASDLYTLESFQEVHTALAPGGVFGLWVNRCRSGEYNDIVYNTLQRVFGNVYQINDNIFIASDTKLLYNAYLPFTDSLSINTLDRKPLSKIFFDECAFGTDSQHLLF